MLHDRKEEYKICIPPLNKPFQHFSHAETEEYFQWHMSHLQERIIYLSSYVACDLSMPLNSIDCSPTSLIPVWKWFLSIVEIERMPIDSAENKDVAEDERAEAFREYFERKAEKRFTLQSEYILQDIGRYLGEVFVKNNPPIYWSFYETPKNDFFVNMPLLMGFADNSFDPPFKMEFEPIHMTRVQASKILTNESHSDDLLKLYTKWVGSYLPKSNE